MSKCEMKINSVGNFPYVYLVTISPPLYLHTVDLRWLGNKASTCMHRYSNNKH